MDSPGGAISSCPQPRCCANFCPLTHCVCVELVVPRARPHHYLLPYRISRIPACTQTLTGYLRLPDMCLQPRPAAALLPACPAPFACVQPRRQYLHFAKHGCTQIFAGRVQPSYPTLSYGYPHIGTLCRGLQLHLALTTRASLQPPSTPRPPPRVPPTPPPPIPPHTHLGTRTHKNSQRTYFYRTCTYSRVLQLPFACLSCTLRVRTAASQVPPLC